ncbi:MAG: hypothetical protein ACFCUV_24000 [Rivularia sp. (in: cyanobacteria)]
MGKAAAFAFAKEGAKVGFCGRRENLGQQVQEDIKNQGGEATYSAWIFEKNLYF